MKVFSWDELVAGNINISGPSALSIGVFDGVHQGHRKLIEKVKNRSDCAPGVVTFSANPSRFFHPHRYLGDIFTLEQKLSVFRELGLTFILLIDFSEEFSALSGEEFVYYIIKYMDIQYVSLGDNFHCGKNASTSAHMVREILLKKGTEVDIQKPFTLDGIPVSSTGIREAIFAGDLRKTTNMLGRNYEVVLNPGAYELSMERATAGRAVFSQVLPGQGTYPVSLSSPGHTYQTELECGHEEITWKQPWRNVYEKIIFM